MEAGNHSSAEVEVNFTLKVGTGTLDASVQVPSRNITLTQLLPVLQTLTNNIVESTVKVANSEGYQVSCRAGCGACCRQLVPLSFFEAEALAEYIRSLPDEQQQELEARFHSALLSLRDSGLLDRLDETTAATEAMALEYMAQKIACPFLQNESCSIHPIRPLVCREYLVVSSPEFCAAPTPDTVVRIPMPIKSSTVLHKFGAELERHPIGWIPLVFLFAWMKKGAKPGNAITGPGPELLYEFVKCLS